MLITLFGELRLAAKRFELCYRIELCYRTKAGQLAEPLHFRMIGLDSGGFSFAWRTTFLSRGGTTETELEPLGQKAVS